MVEKGIYVDDCLTGAEDVDSAIVLQKQLHSLFACGGFVLRKWNSSDPSVLASIPSELRETSDVHPISDSNDYTRTLGVKWNTTEDSFYVSVSKLSPSEQATKRALVSDIAKVFDVFGWFAPAGYRSHEDSFAENMGAGSRLG